MALNVNQERKIAKSNASAIHAALTNMRGNWASGGWLKAKNRYKTDCVGRIAKDLSSGTSITHSHLREYIAASTVTHCLDGWSYLGRAMDADLRGDPGVACHLAYYAELRAAMSILASQGVGVLNTRHAVIDGKSRCDCFAAKGTHVFTWDALKYWATTTASVSMLFSIIAPGGIPLQEWLSRFFVGSGFQSTLGESWLKQWGLDLARQSEDRDARNVASYRPTSFTSTGATSASDTLDAIQEMWSLCEPVGNRQFAIMDRYLLRQSLALTFKEMHGCTPRQAPKKYTSSIQTMLHGLAPDDLSSDMWHEFLTYKSSDFTPQFFLDAVGYSKALNGRHSKQVMARATLLLRVSTGSAGRVLSSLSGMKSSELRFWWSPLGEDRGLWNAASEPSSFVDLWADIRDALEDIERWRNTVGDDVTYFEMWSSTSHAATVLGTMERTGLWGLGL